MHFLLFQVLLSLIAPTLSVSEEDMRDKILSALEKATAFLHDSYNDINVDALLGYRILQAYLDAVLEKWEPQPELQLSRDRAGRLEGTLSVGLEKAERAMERNTPDYYQTFAPALAPGFWKVPHRWTETDPPPASSSSDAPKCLNGDMSDMCISHLLGTWGDGEQPCFVPDYCPDVMTQMGCTGYSLSHQLFYFMFAEVKGCPDPLFLNASFYKKAFCASMKKINIDAEKEARLHVFGDLFVENILFCGMCGFSDFYNPQWLEIILNWQNPEKGCFWMYGDLSQSSNQNSGEARTGLRRAKRQEKILKGGCASHNTGVAVAALGGFLHFGF